jgi:acetylornithine/N-succinyldiaminopimelate aminotransferase
MSNPLPLAAEDLHSDPRIKEAKKLLLAAVSDHQAKLQGIKPADPLRKEHYHQLIQTFEGYRGGKLWFPYLGSGIGKGALVELLDGSIKYDFISGIGPHIFGHSNLNIISSSIDAAISNTVMQGHLQQNKDALDVCELLLKISKLDHCFLTSTGVMAVENGLKIAFQYKSPAHRILCFERCFAGRTWTASQITDKPSYREGLPLNVFVDYIPFYDPDRPDESTREALQALKKILARYPGQHALMIFELVQGEGGIYCGSKAFFTALMTLLQEHNIPILIDEIQTFTRLPELFAFQFFGLEKFADLVTIGKASQISATLYKKKFLPKPGLLSQTFTGSTSAIKASLALLEELLQGDFYGPDGKISQMHQLFASRLAKIAERHPQLIKGPFGVGSMIAFTPFDGEQKAVNDFALALFEEGVLTFVAGIHPTRIRMLPPLLTVTHEDIDQVAKIIEKTLVKEHGRVLKSK